MQNPERSSHIFTLASEVGIPLTINEVDVPGDDAFKRFSERYRAWASQRDDSLISHLLRTPTLFRSYLPFSRRVFAVAYQVVWYFDELVVRDPVLSKVDQLDRDLNDVTKKTFWRSWEFSAASDRVSNLDMCSLLAARSFLICRIRRQTRLVRCYGSLNSFQSLTRLSNSAWRGATMTGATNGLFTRRNSTVGVISASSPNILA